MLNQWTKYAFMLLLMLNLSACQQMLPKAQGLVSSQWSSQQYQRQDQVEVQWQQQDQNLDVLALSLTGQQLFKLHFDGQKVTVEQRIEQMKLLPFDFLMRDILFATYPDFIQHPPEKVSINSVQQGEIQTQDVEINQQKVLTIQRSTAYIELNNLQVPYQMVFSTVPNTLENNE